MAVANTTADGSPQETDTRELMSPEERNALQQVSSTDVDFSAIRGLDATEAGEEAKSIDELEDPFLIVSAYVQPTEWEQEDKSTRPGFVTHLLCMLDPRNPTKLSEVYSNSDSIAGKIALLLEKDDLGPEHPVVVKFDSQKTRANRTVNKLIAPTKAELQSFIGALSKSA